MRSAEYHITGMSRRDRFTFPYLPVALIRSGPYPPNVVTIVWTGPDLTGDKYIVSGDRATDLPPGFADNVRSWWNVSGNRFCLENYIAETGQFAVLDKLEPETLNNVPGGADGPHGANRTEPC